MSNPSSMEVEMTSPLLPVEIIFEIIHFLDVEDKILFRLVSRGWKEILDAKFLVLSATLGMCTQSILAKIPQRTEMLKIDCSWNDGWLRFAPSLLTRLEVPYLSDKSMPFLPKGLIHLKIDDCSKITDEGVKHLPPNLFKMEFLNSCITSQGYSYFPQSIRLLDLSYSNSSDQNGAIKSLPRHLTKLILYDWTSLTDEALKFMPPDLQILNMCYCTQITGTGLEHLPRNLKHLDLENTDVGDDGLEHLPPSLQFLDLSGTRVSDLAFPKLPRLQRLLMVRTAITPKGIQQIPSSVTSLGVSATLWEVEEENSLDVPLFIQQLEIFYRRGTSYSKEEIQARGWPVDLERYHQWYKSFLSSI